MNKPIEALLLQPDEAFANYLKNTAARIDEPGEAAAHQAGARVGISRPHESAHLHDPLSRSWPEKGSAACQYRCRAEKALHRRIAVLALSKPSGHQRACAMKSESGIDSAPVTIAAAKTETKGSSPASASRMVK